MSTSNDLRLLDAMIVHRLEHDGFCLLKMRDHGRPEIVVEDDHWVTFNPDRWFIEHSLACRINGGVGSCPYHTAIETWIEASMYIPAKDNGVRYRIAEIDENGFPVLHFNTEGKY